MYSFQSFYSAASDTADYSHFFTLSVFGFPVIIFFQLPPYFLFGLFLIHFPHISSFVHCLMILLPMFTSISPLNTHSLNIGTQMSQKGLMINKIIFICCHTYLYLQPSLRGITIHFLKVPKQEIILDFSLFLFINHQNQLFYFLVSTFFSCFPIIEKPAKNSQLRSLGCPLSEPRETFIKQNSRHVTTGRFTSTPPPLRSNQSSLHYDTQYFITCLNSPSYPLSLTLRGQTACVIVFYAISLHISFTNVPQHYLPGKLFKIKFLFKIQFKATVLYKGFIKSTSQIQVFCFLLPAIVHNCIIATIILYF